MLLNTHSNLRPEAVDVISQLHSMGKEVQILTGDSAESVEKLSIVLNIPFSCQHPEQSAIMKMEWIKSIQQEGRKGVMMIGDGNDKLM
jgi:P-type E1-E2 ATPase